MEIETIKIKDLKPYKNNTKKHPPEQIDKIARSITAFGFKQPILIDKDNVVIAGHGRLEAAESCGMDEVPCIRDVDLTPEKVMAYRIADNKVAESEWDETYLKLEFEKLQDNNFEYLLTGFEQEEVEALFNEIEEKEETPKAKTEFLKTCPHCGGELK